MPKYIYTDNSGLTHPIRVSQATASTGAFTQGTPTSPIPAKVSKTNRSIGLRPRGLRISTPSNPGPNDKIKYHFLPIATDALWNSSTEGTTVTYNGTQWIVNMQVPEDYR